MMVKIFSHLLIGLVAINLAVVKAQLFWVVVNNDLGPTSSIENQTIISNVIKHDIGRNAPITSRSSGLVSSNDMDNFWVHYRTNIDNMNSPLGRANPGGHIFRPKSCPKCSCGLKFQNKSLGKQMAEKFEFPWLTLIYYQNKFACGGTLINDRYVLTAAHCVENSPLTQFDVRFHDYSQYQRGTNSMTKVKITQIVMHPNFHSQSLDYDYAILKLEKPIDLTKNAPKPICLPKGGNSYAGELAQDAGWGYEIDVGSRSAKLRKTILRVVPNESCNQQWNGGITRRMICVHSKSGEQNVCFGDSGGPLMVVQDGRYRIAGVNSYVEKCVNPKLPAVVSRVTTVLPWIKANTPDGCYCDDMK